jgi:excisionase family DNA binding protein
MTAEQVAALLLPPTSTVKDYARRGVLPSIKLGKHRRFVRSQVERAIEALAGHRGQLHDSMLAKVWRRSWKRIRPRARRQQHRFIVVARRALDAHHPDPVRQPCSGDLIERDRPFGLPGVLIRRAGLLGLVLGDKGRYQRDGFVLGQSSSDK